MFHRKSLVLNDVDDLILRMSPGTSASGKREEETTPGGVGFFFFWGNPWEGRRMTWRR